MQIAPQSYWGGQEKHSFLTRARINAFQLQSPLRTMNIHWINAITDNQVAASFFQRLGHLHHLFGNNGIAFDSSRLIDIELHSINLIKSETQQHEEEKKCIATGKRRVTCVCVMKWLIMQEACSIEQEIFLID